MTPLYEVVEQNLYAQFIQPFCFLRKEVSLACETIWNSNLVFRETDFQFV